MIKSVKMMAFGLIVSGSLAGCAQQPERIAAIEVSGTPYKGFSCKQLAAEHLKISQELQAASAAQKRAASGDAWGVFLLGLPLSSMSGNDKEATIAVAKGRINELDRVQLARGC
ncbi:hypothetical protein [Roseobacter sinensis]|uniref:Lipoprotein n=1 Tax=Roseobacter sinensis TaxID=2931391 RepID=A0ABT3BAV1_9RHOB|nr:hypothetical protein [Roseobacter sp. WL0113]MCV3270677.1 hypothetical protein [Roseobacter sp. WL0113]